MAGFTNGEKSAIVYDRFDLWQVNLDGSNPVRLTRGREDSTVYRCATEGGGLAAAVAAAVASVLRRAPRPANSTAKGARSTRASRSFSRRQANTTRRAATRGSPSVSPCSGFSGLDKQVSGLRKAKNADVSARAADVRGVAELFRCGAVTERREAGVAHQRVPGRLRVGQAGVDGLQQQTRRQAADDARRIRRTTSRERSIRWSCTTTRSCRRAFTNTSCRVSAARTARRTSARTDTSCCAGHRVPGAQSRIFRPRLRDIAVEDGAGAVSDIDAKRVGNMGHSWGGYQSAFYAVHNHGIVRRDDRRRSAHEFDQLLWLHVRQLGIAGNGSLRDGPGANAGFALGRSASVYPQLHRVGNRLAPDPALARGRRRRRQRQFTSRARSCTTSAGVSARTSCTSSTKPRTTGSRGRKVRPITRGDNSSGSATTSRASPLRNGLPTERAISRGNGF